MTAAVSRVPTTDEGATWASWLHQAKGRVASLLNADEEPSPGAGPERGTRAAAAAASPSLWLDLGPQWRPRERRHHRSTTSPGAPGRPATHAHDDDDDDDDPEEALRRAWLATALAHREHNEASVWLYALPEELQLLLFSHFGAGDLAAVSLVSTLFHRLASDNALWRLQFERAQGGWKVACNVGAEPLPSGASQLARWFEEKLAFTHSALSQLIPHQHHQHHQQHHQRWHDPSASLAAEMTCAALVDWKSQYHIHHSESVRHVKPTRSKSEVVLTKFGAAPSSSPLSFLPKSIRTTLQRKQVFKVPMFGRGLDLSAKKLLYNMIWSLESPFPVCGLHPGSGGIGSGVAFNVEGKELNLTVIYEEEGVFEKLRPVWRDFLQKDSSGLILVMDNRGDTESLAMAKRELARFVSYDCDPDDDRARECSEKEDEQERPLAVTTLPLLVFLCDAGTDDVPPETRPTAPPLTAARVAHEFALSARMRGRKWCVRHVCPDSLQGIAEGLHWLAANL